MRELDRGLADVLAASTRSVVFAHLRSIFMATVDDELIAKRPCSARSVARPRVVARQVVPWTLDQVMTVRSGLRPGYQTLFDVGWGCGLRQGEVFGLAEDDFDPDGGWLDVRRQVKKVGVGLVFGLPKSDKARRIPLPVSLGKALQSHMADVAPLDVTDPTGELVTVRPVFTTPRRTAINRAAFDEHSWRPALKHAGITPSRSNGMHALRHFHASSLLDAGGEHQGAVAVPRACRPGLHAAGLYPPDALERGPDAARDRRPGGELDGPQTAQGPK